MIPFNEYRISKAEAQDIMCHLGFLRQVSKRLSKIGPEDEERLLRNLKELIPLIPVYSKELHLKNELHRISINRFIRDDNKNSRLDYLTQLKYPPLDKVDKLDYNRASLKKQSVFYAGLGILNTSIENPSQTGELITQSTWKQKQGTLVRIAPIFQSANLVYRNPSEYEEKWKNFNTIFFNVEPYIAQLIREIYAFITEEFLKRANKKDKKIEYLFSAYFANSFYESGVEAIVYPSVPNDYFCENIAVIPQTLNEKFDFIEAKEDMVVNDPSNSNVIIENFAELENFFKIIRETKHVHTPNLKTSRGWGLQNISTAKYYNRATEKLKWETNIPQNILSELQDKYSFEL